MVWIRVLGRHFLSTADKLFVTSPPCRVSVVSSPVNWEKQQKVERVRPAVFGSSMQGRRGRGRCPPQAGRGRQGIGSPERGVPWERQLGAVPAAATPDPSPCTRDYHGGARYAENLKVVGIAKSLSSLSFCATKPKQRQCQLLNGQLLPLRPTSEPDVEKGAHGQRRCCC